MHHISVPKTQNPSLQGNILVQSNANSELKGGRTDELFHENISVKLKEEKKDNLRLPVAKISDHRSKFLQGSLY